VIFENSKNEQISLDSLRAHDPSGETENLIGNLIVRDVKGRFGNTDTGQIKSHPFFHNDSVPLDWDNLPNNPDVYRPAQFALKKFNLGDKFLFYGENEGSHNPNVNNNGTVNPSQTNTMLNPSSSYMNFGGHMPSRKMSMHMIKMKVRNDHVMMRFKRERKRLADFKRRKFGNFMKSRVAGQGSSSMSSMGVAMANGSGSIKGGMNEKGKGNHRYNRPFSDDEFLLKNAKAEFKNRFDSQSGRFSDLYDNPADFYNSQELDPDTYYETYYANFQSNYQNRLYYNRYNSKQHGQLLYLSQQNLFLSQSFNSSDSNSSVFADKVLQEEENENEDSSTSDVQQQPPPQQQLTTNTELAADGTSSKKDYAVNNSEKLKASANEVMMEDVSEVSAINVIEAEKRPTNPPSQRLEPKATPPNLGDMVREFKANHGDDLSMSIANDAFSGEKLSDRAKGRPRDADDDYDEIENDRSMSLHSVNRSHSVTSDRTQQS
jgi:hypothetical protein